jgi:PAS domain S-box-containing protein
MANTADSAPDGWQALFWTAFGRSDTAMCVLDEHRVRLAVNAGLCRQLRRGRDELIGRRLEDDLAPHAVARVVADWERCRHRGAWTGQAEIVRGDGTILRTHYSAHAVEVGGRALTLTVLRGDREPSAGTPPGGLALSPRERTVVHLLSLGLGSAAIAERMSISVETVRTHVRNAMTKSGARTRAQLVAGALGESRRDPPSEV